MPRPRKTATLPVTYKSGFLTTLDGRTELARALRERFESIVADLGGKDELSTIKASLIERFVWLEAALVKIEGDLANTTDARTSAEVLGRWTQGCNALLGYATRLGIERKLSAAPWTLPAEPQQ